MPKEMRDDTAFHDRIHAYLPGWDVPKLDPSYFTHHFGFVSDFLAECWSQLRRTSRLDVTQGRLEWGSQLSGRDRKAANNTVNGLLKLLWPNPEMEVPDDALAWAAELALELRRRVKEQQAFIGAAEFGNVDLSYRVGDGPEKVVYCDESVQHRLRAESEPRRREQARRRQRRAARARSGGGEVSVGAKAADYAVGDVIDGRFEILDMLGQGGFSKVYRVRDEVEGEERAFKLFDNAAGYDAVRREIGALRKIHHPNVVEVFWAGKTDAGDWYLITEYIDGESLDDYATGKRHLRDREADRRRARRARRPRRDPPRLRPARGARPKEARRRALRGRVRRVDGAAGQGPRAPRHQAAERHAHPHRREASRLQHRLARRRPGRTRSPGTPPYQAPDADLTRWDVSTDLFAVGVMLYELLCNGQHPYPDSRPMVGESVIDPMTIRPDLAPEVAAFLVKACAPRRDMRFANALEMKDALSSTRSRER